MDTQGSYLIYECPPFQVRHFVWHVRRKSSPPKSSDVHQFKTSSFHLAERGAAMSKPDRVAYGVIVLAIAAGCAVGGRAGIILGVVGGLLGSGLLVWLIVSSAKHEEAGETSPASDYSAPEAYAAHEETKIFLIVRDAHARALPESDSGFDIFLNLWLASETEFDVAMSDFQLTLTASDGAARSGERISGDLEKWHLGKEREESDMWDTYVHASLERVPELNTAEALHVGIPREGWLHFRLQNITPEEFRTQPMGLTLIDAFSHVHLALVTCPRHLPGKVWPLRGQRAQKAS
jgi:hypothetical protein